MQAFFFSVAIWLLIRVLSIESVEFHFPSLAHHRNEWRREKQTNRFNENSLFAFAFLPIKIAFIFHFDLHLRRFAVARLKVVHLFAHFIRFLIYFIVSISTLTRTHIHTYTQIFFCDFFSMPLFLLSSTIRNFNCCDCLRSTRCTRFVTSSQLKWQTHALNKKH